ncbi:MAG: zinc ribbon domain-containing protein [Clostridia bacterium]|nr:zinc ribbon domain-containing protein [Clostridia bacterium]MBQ2256545.1 zinc ribbon domain-containing protein [Clostridia bacterium]MBQ5362186.1 zinc ribbon domain-containing protein [Clostridia bacterium]MBQ5793379.1 zinc ribbon domain-containing protein [Clostridia bacterium]
MVCPFCQAEITAEDKVCPMCGAPVNEQTEEKPAAKVSEEQLATQEAPAQKQSKSGMILGIVAAALVLAGCCCCYLGVITVPVAGVLAIIGLIKNVGELKKAKQAGVKNTFALVGTILSAVALAIAVAMIVFVVLYIALYGFAALMALLSGEGLV